MPKQNKRVMKHTLMRAEKIKGKHNFHRFLLIMTVRGLSKQLSCIIHVKNVESNRFFRPHYGRVIKLNHLSTCAIYVEVICIAKIWITRNLVVILKCIFFKHMNSDFSSNRKTKPFQYSSTKRSHNHILLDKLRQQRSTIIFRNISVYLPYLLRLQLWFPLQLLYVQAHLTVNKLILIS